MEESPKLYQARLALNKLVEGYINHPAVTLIGIGLSTGEGSALETTGEIVLRIYMKPGWHAETAAVVEDFPSEVDGFRVLVVPGTFHLE